MLRTDYLIVGSGAVGMSFADQLLTETNTNMVIVDRHHMAGGHWKRRLFVRPPACAIGVLWRGLASTRQQPHRHIRA